MSPLLLFHIYLLRNLVKFLRNAHSLIPRLLKDTRLPAGNNNIPSCSVQPKIIKYTDIIIDMVDESYLVHAMPMTFFTQSLNTLKLKYPT